MVLTGCVVSNKIDTDRTCCYQQDCTDRTVLTEFVVSNNMVLLGSFVNIVLTGSFVNKHGADRMCC